MSDDDRLARLTRIRREPPPLEAVTVVDRVELTPRLIRLTFEGDGLRDLVVEEPAASVRLLVPTPGTTELVNPTWNGNEFLLPDGSRPALRTFTPLRADNDAGRLDLEIVRHPGGAVSQWAETARTGAPAAISGPGTGYQFPASGPKPDTHAQRLVVLADETALPAVTQLVAAAPDDLALEIHIEAIRDDAQLDIGAQPKDDVRWHVTQYGEHPGGELVEVVQSIDRLPDETHVWAAGEASAMHKIRGHLFDTLGAERTRATVRGYWKPAR